MRKLWANHMTMDWMTKQVVAGTCSHFVTAKGGCSERTQWTSARASRCTTENSTYRFPMYHSVGMATRMVTLLFARNGALIMEEEEEEEAVG